MRNLMLSVLSLGALALLAGDASAFGFKKKKSCGGCESSCAAPASYGCGGCGGCGGGYYGGMPYHHAGMTGSPAAYAAMPSITGSVASPDTGVTTASGTTSPSGVTTATYAAPAGQPNMVYPAGYTTGMPYQSGGITYPNGMYDTYSSPSMPSSGGGRMRMFGGRMMGGR